MCSASSPSIILQKPQTSVIFSPPNTLPVSVSAPRNLRIPSLARVFLVKTSKYSSFSPQPPFSAVSPDDDDEPVIGDCLVYEEGIFDDPFLQNSRNLRNDDVRTSVRKSISKYTEDVPTENLIPDDWLDVQKEINTSKKERRKLSQQLEYGKSVEKRRKALMPLDSNSEVLEKLKKEKLQQLKPLVLDEPKPPQRMDNNNNHHNNYEETNKVVTARVAPRNPRLAVYGVGLEDISAVFSSGSYGHGASKKSQGTPKLFSKEEKLLMNRRVPNLAVAVSGKWHPLHTLAASGEFYLVSYLLKHNLDINVCDQNGLTAIHKAIIGRKQAIFNFLLRESANPFVRDNEGSTLMHYAVFTASTQMIKILLLYNVDINLQDNDGWTPLHLAVQSRRIDIIRLLLIKGADKSLKNQNGLTALDICLYSGRDTKTYEVIKLLKLFP